MKKNIALIIPSLAAGGAEKVIVLLANTLCVNYQIILIVLYKTETFYIIEKEVEVIYIKSKYTPSMGMFQALSSNVSYLVNIIRVLKTNSIDLVISFTTVTNFLSFISCKFLSIPIIISERKNPLLNKLNIYWQFLEKITNKYSDILVVQSEMIRNVYKKFVAKKKIEVIPNPVDIKMKSFLQDYNCSQRENIILTVGRLDANKNQKMLIEAFANLNVKDWRLVIVGDGILKEEYMILTKSLGIEHMVDFVGNVQNVWDYYNQAKIFAFTSNSEGFPNALLEAMSFGLPCVSTDCPSGPSEIILNNENGYLIEVGNIKQLEDRLSILMCNPDICYKFSENAIISTEKFSIAEVKKLWEAQIKKML
ncbi:MAG: glycosyltransferase family 4 protein [Bacteroidetes bacterium]|nr:glycosyltransferase family 4 protein [Bacteroidota bacterium]